LSKILNEEKLEILKYFSKPAFNLKKIFIEKNNPDRADEDEFNEDFGLNQKEEFINGKLYNWINRFRS
jgi:hypothetical protein